MSRRRRPPAHPEEPKHEAWVIPYADLLTLLLALFVVLYAMSTINVSKYRTLSAAFSAAFNGVDAVQPRPGSAARLRAPRTPAVHPGTPLDRAAPIMLPLPQRSPATPIERPPAPFSPLRIDTEQQDLERIRSRVEHALQPLIDKKLVLLRRTASWLEIEIRTDILFPSGVARLSPTATGVLGSLGQILAPFANPLRVEGYTDDVPINTEAYPSNWELSAARAASVARLFAERGVDPARMGIIGWGEYHPAADNASQDGRNRNRRVLVVVLSDRDAPTRFYSNPGSLPASASATFRDVPQQQAASPLQPAAVEAAGANVSQRSDGTGVVPPSASMAPISKSGKARVTGEGATRADKGGQRNSPVDAVSVAPREPTSALTIGSHGVAIRPGAAAARGIPPAPGGAKKLSPAPPGVPSMTAAGSASSRPTAVEMAGHAAALLLIPAMHGDTASGNRADGGGRGE